MGILNSLAKITKPAEEPPKKNKETDTANKIIMIPTDDLVPNTMQPRNDFGNIDLNALAESITKFGIIQPIIVKRREDIPHVEIDGENVYAERYEIITGERRWRAAKLAGLDSVPCILKEADKRTSAKIAIIENVQRKDLNFFEEAEAMQKLIAVCEMTQADVGKLLSMSQPAIANKLRLLKLGENERIAIISAGLTERHARALIRINDSAARMTVLQRGINASMSAAEFERNVDAYINTAENVPETMAGDRKKRIGLITDVRFFINSLDRAIDIVTNAGVGVEKQQTDKGNYIEVVLKIPKSRQEKKTQEKSFTQEE